ncbi:hypothetical protein J6590_020887 [Homalodisca vitripennis]|nr:hypothetical protein J6590_020887 [Homalodisca vitripennis]
MFAGYRAYNKGLQGTRSQDLFGHLHHATNYEMNSTINRMQRLGILLLGTLTTSMMASPPLKELLL